MSDPARRGAAVLREYLRRGVLGTDPEVLLDLCDLCRHAEGGPMGLRKRDVPPEVWAAFCPANPVRSKYGNRKVTVGGQVFDSEKEARRYAELRLLEDAGAISGLETQVEFRLEVGGVLVAKYVADFVYVEGGARVVEDVKSEATRKNRAYRIKAKLMRGCHGIEIKET